ncbi:hypothetical protein ONS96_009479 [Cadophora gregata f. sp. sojae]|nr:hypothetical protein ONS96_009479 [Cadophora gregata f. sp. sojae]
MSPNPRSGLGIRKSNTEYIDRDVDTWTHTSGDGSISSPTNLSTSTEPRHTSESNPSLELRSEKYSASEARDAESRNGIEERDGTRYITLTVTRSSGTYVTLVELGDTTLPTSYQVTQSQTTTYSSPPLSVSNPLETQTSDGELVDRAFQTQVSQQELSSASSWASPSVCWL